MTDQLANTKSYRNRSKAITPLRLNSFFAGIGGFDLGFQRAGCMPVFHCEINSYCRSILEQHWPNVNTSADINDVQASSLPQADIWCGGFPCQDVSVARGSKGRAGLKGQNTGLFYPFMDLVREAQPAVLLLENVTGLLNSHGGRDFLTVIRTLTEMGYGVSWRVFNTRYFGAPQSRPRVYICAWRNDVAAAVASLYEAEGMHKPEGTRAGFLTPYSCSLTGAVVPNVAYCLAATSGRHTGTDWSRSYVSYYDKVRRLTPTECEGLQGFPLGWTVPSKDSSLSVDEIDTLRYHALGNAVSTPVIEWIAKRMVGALRGRENSPQFKDACDQVIGDRLEFCYQEFKRDSLRKQKISELEKNAGELSFAVKWKTGGFAIGDDIFDSVASAAPFNPTPSRLIDVIEKRDVANHYYLSSNAAQGILRRVSSQNRELFEPLKDALVRLAALQAVKTTSSSSRSSGHPYYDTDLGAC